MASVVEAVDTRPIFKAVSSSARQLYQLLNCINFAPKVHVQINSEGIRFAVEDSRVMQGTSCLPKLAHDDILILRLRGRVS
jgi:cell cycle checkpoint protein